MAAHFIVDVDVKNPQAYEAYQQAAASIAQYGGRYLVRGRTHEVLEGPGARRASWCWSSLAWTPQSAGMSLQSAALSNPSAWSTP